MQKLNLFAAAVALPLFFAYGCGDDGSASGTETNGSGGSSGGDPTDGGAEVCDSEISGTIEVDTVWACNHTLKDIVTVKGGAKLTVMPGVTVKGLAGSALVIGKGSQLIAEGTQDMPIVFTSALDPGGRARGDWGGVVLLGEAKNNLVNGAGAAEGLDANDPNYQYGGSDDASSCGSLKWVRVEFAGFELTKDNELNGITFYSCGTGTTVEYVQVNMGKDDGMEFFGGKFDLKHVVITGALDDSLDMDQGFTGKIQHVYIHQESSTANYAFEISDQKDNFDAEPRTKPVIANVTAIGTDATGTVETKSAGIRLKEGGALELHNAILVQFHNAAVELTDPATEAVATAGGIVLQHNLFWKNSGVDMGATPYIVDSMSTFDLKAFVEDAANNNQIDVDPMLNSYDYGGDITPKAGSPVLGAGMAPAGFDAADYLGAVKDAASDWTRGWTDYSVN